MLPLARRMASTASRRRVFDRRERRPAGPPLGPAEATTPSSAGRKRAQRDRAAALVGWEAGQMLREAMAQQLLDRLADVRGSCEVVAELDAGCGAASALWSDQARVRRWIEVEMSAKSLERSAQRMGRPARSVPAAAAGAEAEPEDDDDDEMLALMQGGSAKTTTLPGGLAVTRVCGDIEHLPLAPSSVDAVVSVLSLHWCNDPVSVLKQAREALRPGGLFLAVLLGGETAHELTTSLTAAELERLGAVGTRSSPLMDVGDASALLSASGLALPAVDTGFVQIECDNAADAMAAMGSLGEAAAPASAADAPPLGGVSVSDVMLATAAFMQHRHGGTALPDEEDADTTVVDPRTRNTSMSDAALVAPVPLTFQTVWLNGFAPSESQPEPLERDSVPKGFHSREQRV